MKFKSEVSQNPLEWCRVCGKKGPSNIKFTEGHQVRIYCPECFQRVRSFMYNLPEMSPEMEIQLLPEYRK